MHSKSRWFLIFILSLFLIMCCCGPDPNETENQPGGITQVVVADSMQIPAAPNYNRSLVKAWISDPDGLKDVDSVYFYSLKPDGNLANSGKPLVLVDNGLSFNIADPWNRAGDETAGDGVYSLSIILDNSALAGRYHFTFYMRDKAGHLSDAVMDSIEVVQ